MRFREMIWGFGQMVVLGAVWPIAACAETTSESRLPTFEAQTIDPNVQIGYGLAIGDVDGDGLPDILLADKTEFVWFRNPDWTRHVMVDNLTPLDNVCLAARDITGDGKVEVAVGANWNPGDTVDSGSVHYLIPPEDRTQRWTAVPLHHEPTTHRMHWVQLAPKRFALVVSPLHGRGNRNGEGEGVRLLAYEMPEDPRQPWMLTLVDDQFNMTHNFDPVQWDPTHLAEELLYIGRQGAQLLSYRDGTWQGRQFPRVEGGGEIRQGLLGPHAPYVATIEPMHGEKLVLYRSAYQRGAESGGEGDDMIALRDRIVLDDNLNGGHGIATGDFLGNGQQQIVAGWRLPNRDGDVGVKLFYPKDAEGNEWDAIWIDKNGMATEDLRVADLNADGLLDIVAAGRQTNNLKIYWNRGR
jgi:hypothetical protein